MILAHLVVLAGLTMGICNPGRLWADPQFTSVTLSDTNPLQGSTLGVTVIFCDNTAWAQNRVNMLGAIQNSGLSGFSIFNCGTSGQVMVVSNAGVNVPTTAYVSGMAISQPTQNGVSGGCPSNPVTATWTITLDPAFFPGGDTYHFVVCGKEDYIDCNATSGAACGSADFSIPLPPAAVTVTASAAESPVAPLGLVRYMVDYSFGNTTGFNITFPLPANTTFVAASPGGGLSGGSVSWALGDATRLKRGQAWVLVRVDASAPDASNLTAVFSGVSNEVGAQTSSASAVVRKPNLALTKSQSAASVNAGNTVTYGLTWTVDGQSLQWDDAYDASTGTPTGFDGSTYNTVSNGGVNGSWTLGTDTDNGQYVLANGGGQYPLMLRSTPLDLCASYNVQGDLYIDPSNTPGVDAHLVIAGNGLSGTSSNYYMVGISGDPTPHKVWLQKNVLGVPVTNMAGGYSDSFTINPGTWYTVKAQLSQSGSALVIAVTVWPRGTVEPSFPLFTCTDTSPLVCSPSGNFIGWQADVGFDRYDNLMLTAPGPVANPVVADTLPTGISYAGSQPALSGGPPLLSWSLAATVFGQPAPIQWWGPACFDPVVNTARIASDGVPAVDSNTLTLNVIGSCGPTPTPTETGTPTNSPTPTTTFTMTSTPTPTPTTTITMTSTPTPTGTSTASSTATNTFTASATSTVTATSTMTSTPTPRPPTATPTPNRQFHLWPNPYNPADAVRGTLKASYMPTGSTLEIVTVSGEKVARLSPVNNRVEWNGKTGKGRAATPGIYYYILSQGASLLEKGEFVLTNGAQ